MSILIAIALKSLLVAGLTLGLLALMKHRSAAERSWVAHIGLLALVVIAFAPLALPSWTVEAPTLLGQAPAVETSAPLTPPTQASVVQAAPLARTPVAARPAITPAAAVSAGYAIPALILLLITFLALARLVALRARAEVLVDGHWLSALARAQRRMGFKHGTALLTSNEVASPISWGLMRPVILLNARALEASRDAEAIIAHELAHVARMDWAKLLLARVATALFWFNPLVWLLAREAHQLREEAADDAVLAADICDTDYAQLLVGVARHECPGLLLGAHGVAPSKNSLARRVARVLDGKSVRGPAARSFAVGVFSGAVLVAAPLAALTLAPGSATQTKGRAGSLAASEPASAYYPGTPEAASDLPHIIASGVSASVATAAAAIAPSKTAPDESDGPNGATSPTLMDSKDIPLLTVAYAGHRHDGEAAKAAALAAIGVTPAYVAEMRALGREFAGLEPSEFAEMRAVGVTPQFARDLIAAGFPGIDPDGLVEARATGLTGGYVRAMRAAGVRGDLDDFVQLRAVGVDPAFAAHARKSGTKLVDVDELIELHTGGMIPPMPPAPPRSFNPPDPHSDPDG